MIKQNVIFIGMSGSGKTTIARELEKKYGYQCIDTDRLIEAYCQNKPLQEIVDTFKDDYEKFLELERKVILEYHHKQIHESKYKTQHESKYEPDKPIAYATGGSLCYSPDVVKTLQGTVIYLSISWDALVKRIGSFAMRGTIVFHQTVEKEYEYRLDLYKKLAHHTINCDNKTIEQTTEEVAKLLIN